MNMNFFKDSACGIHALSDDDIAAGGEAYLPIGCVSVTAVEVQAILAPPLTASQLHDNLVAAAKAALEISDRVCLRCYKAGVQFPSAWQTWTISCRAIANGTDTASTALQPQPAYPVGT